MWTLHFSNYSLLQWRSTAVHSKHINSASLTPHFSLFVCSVYSTVLPIVVCRCDTWAVTVSTEHKLNFFELMCSCKVYDLRWRQQKNTGERYIQKSFAVSILIHYIPDSGQRRLEVVCLQAGPQGIVVQSPWETRDLSLFRRGQSVSGATQPPVQRVLAGIPLW